MLSVHILSPLKLVILHPMPTELTAAIPLVPPRRDPGVRGLQSTHRGPLYPQSAGPPLAQQVPEMQRLPGPAGGQVLQQGRQRLLQGGFFQVSSFQ